MGPLSPVGKEHFCSHPETCCCFVDSEDRRAEGVQWKLLHVPLSSLLLVPASSDLGMAGFSVNITACRDQQRWEKRQSVRLALRKYHGCQSGDFSEHRSFSDDEHLSSALPRNRQTKKTTQETARLMMNLWHMGVSGAIGAPEAGLRDGH